MIINPVLSSSPSELSRNSGIYSGLDRVSKAAHEIAGVAVENSNQLPTKLTPALVELKLGERQVAASAAVIRTADEVLGTLLDIKA